MIVFDEFPCVCVICGVLFVLNWWGEVVKVHRLMFVVEEFRPYELHVKRWIKGWKLSLKIFKQWVWSCLLQHFGGVNFKEPMKILLTFVISSTTLALLYTIPFPMILHT